VTERARGEVAWDWLRRAVCLVGFVYGAFVKEGVSVIIVFLSLCGAVFPAAEFRALLKSWRRNGDS
jgi:hypothetical protein